MFIIHRYNQIYVKTFEHKKNSIKLKHTVIRYYVNFSIVNRASLLYVLKQLKTYIYPNPIITDILITTMVGNKIRVGSTI